jgi:hypothetical protein
MKRLLEILTLMLALGMLPAMAQSDYPDRDHDRDHDRSYAEYQGRMSPDDQRDFNHQYDEWQEAKAKNNLEDVDKHARKMGEIMARYRIPPDTPFDLIATSGGNPHRYDVREFQGRLSHDDQKRFDKAYEEWVENKRKNDRDDVAKAEGTMQEIMGRYHIPRDVPYDVLASSGRQ